MKSKKEIEKRLSDLNTFLGLGEETGMSYNKRLQIKKEVEVLKWVLGKENIRSLKEKHKISQTPAQDTILEYLRIQKEPKTTLQIASDLLYPVSQPVGLTLKRLKKRGAVERFQKGRTNKWRVRK